ncbi:MAG: hypothetical protein V3U75_13355 [Methylococcaceae bacterium]
MATGIRSNGFTEYPVNPANSSGKKLKSVFYEKTIATGAGTNTLHILSGPHGYDDKINAVVGATPALTSANDNDLGFYKLEEDGTFTAIDADILWDGADLSSALTYRELLGTLNTSLDRDDNIGTLLSLTSESEPIGGVYLGLLVIVASTAASEVLKLEVKVEEATTK